MWRRQLERLGKYHCLAPDLPGHGGSSELRPFSLETSVEGLAELVRTEIPSGRASVLGFSVGAVIAIGLRNRYPDLVERVYVSGPTPKFGRLATALMNAASRVFLGVLSAELRGKLVARSLGLSETEVEEFRDDLGRITPELFFQINEVVANQPDPQPDGPPAVVFVGEKEIRPTKDRARHLAKVVGNDMMYLVPDLGHGWCVEDPELFHSTVRAWMSGDDMGDGVVGQPV